MSNLEVVPPVPKKTTKSKYKEKKAKQGKPVKEIPQDLSDKVKSLKALVSLHNLIKRAGLKVEDFEAASQGLIFLETLHQTVMADAMKHPDAMLVPQLKEHALKEAANGKK